MMSYVAALLLLAPIAVASSPIMLSTDVMVSTFDGDADFSQQWAVSYVSPSTGSIVFRPGNATFSADVLSAPGVKVTATVDVARGEEFSDVQECDSLTLVVSDNGKEEFDGYYVSVGNYQNADLGYRAPFEVPVGPDFQKVVIDFDDFVYQSSSFENYRSLSATKKDFQTLVIRAQNYKGDVELDIKAIYGSDCGDDDELTIVDRAILTPALSNLTSILHMEAYADILEVVKGDGPFTFFAPTNAAFKAAGLTKTADIRKALLYHVLSGVALKSTDLSVTQTQETAGGSDLVITVDGGVVSVNNAKVTTANIGASNGVVHIIDAVLMPPKSVLENIMDTAELSLYTSQLDRWGKVKTLLKGDGPFTVFAISDTAFQAFNASDPTGYDDRVTVQAIMQYFILDSAVFSSELTATQNVVTVDGSTMKITVVDGVVTLNDVAVVTTADILSSNGVVHIVDTVLEPVSLSCDSSCGQRTSAGCYCDSACTTEGDCCSDYEDKCVTNHACTDHCGSKSAGPCWCDYACIEYGDCCDSFRAECPAELVRTTCVGRCGNPQVITMNLANVSYAVEDQCYCDDNCTIDCCDDYTSVC